MTRLALIRHAPTDWNHQGRMQGRGDRPVTAKDLVHFTRLRPPAALRDWQWLSSPLRRARQTAEALAGAAVPVDDRLIEQDWGAWEGCSLADLAASDPLYQAMEDQGWSFCPPDGEPMQAVQERLQDFLAEYARRGGDWLAVCHKGVILSLLALALGWNLTGKRPLRLLPGSVQVLRLCPDGRPVLERANWPLDLVGSAR